MVKSYVEKVEVNEKVYPVVKDFMIDPPVTFNTSDEIYIAMKTLLSFGVSGAPVLDDKGLLAGFISERDCLRLVALNVYHNSRRSGIIEDYMTGREGLTTVDTQTDLYKVAQLFVQLPYKKLLVVENEKLLGVVRRGDVLKVVQQ